MKDKIKFDTNSLYLLAIESSDNIEDEEDIRKKNLTELFYKEIEMMIKSGELINISINGRVRLGKSTVGIKIGKEILEMLVKHNQKPKGTKFSMENLARDQQEYSKYMRNENYHHTVIVTDESNELEKGGENSTAEYALNKVMSDVQAGRYVHRVSCSPKETIDPNSDIILEVIAQNKRERTTHCLLYYKYVKAGYERTQLVGHVNIDVSDVIDNWEDIIKPIFFKFNERTEKEQELLNEAIKKDFYIEYTVKKYEKMDLITKEGVFRPRELDYAQIVLKVVERLKTAVKKIRNPKETAKNYIKMEMRKEKIPTTMIGIEIATQSVMGVLSLYKEYFNLEKDIEKYKKKGDVKEVEELIGIKNEMAVAISLQMEELRRYKEINEQYHSKNDYTR